MVNPPETIFLCLKSYFRASWKGRWSSRGCDMTMLWEGNGSLLYCWSSKTVLLPCTTSSPPVYPWLLHPQDGWFKAPGLKGRMDEKGFCFARSQMSASTRLEKKKLKRNEWYFLGTAVSSGGRGQLEGWEGLGCLWSAQGIWKEAHWRRTDGWGSWQSDTEPFTSGSPSSSTALVKDGTEPSPARGCSMRNGAAGEQLLSRWRRGTAFFIPDPSGEMLGKHEGRTARTGSVAQTRWHCPGVTSPSQEQGPPRDAGVAVGRRKHPQEGRGASTCQHQPRVLERKNLLLCLVNSWQCSHWPQVDPRTSISFYP